MSDQRLRLADGLHAPSHARAWVAQQLPPLPVHVVEDTMLLVSELVTNAVRHGRPDVVVGLTVTEDRIRIAVQDGADALPVVPKGQPSVDRATGRGLLIVDATALEWGVERADGATGKTVWAVLDPNAPARWTAADFP